MSGLLRTSVLRRTITRVSTSAYISASASKSASTCFRLPVFTAIHRAFSCYPARNAFAPCPSTPRCYSTASPSISHGPTDAPALLTQTIPEHFASIVAQFPDNPAVIARAPVSSAVATGEGRRQASLPPVTTLMPPRETVYTYGDLDRVSDLLAHGLQSRLGVRKGDRVAISLGNGAEFAALTYALFKLGAVLVPLNPAFTATQVAAALRHLGAKVLIIGAVTDLAYKPGRGRSNLPLLSELVDGEENLSRPAGERIQSSQVPTLEAIVLVDNTADHIAVAGSHDFADTPTQRTKSALTPFSYLTDGIEILRDDQIAALRDAPPPPVRPDESLDASDTINIQFTSGTTSQPKAAMLSHTAILNNGYFIGRRMELTPEDKVVCPPPLFHCFGSVLGYMATATSGSAILFSSPAFDPAASLQMAAEHRASGLYGVSTMYIAMLEWLEQLNHQHQSQLQHTLSAGTNEIRQKMAELPTHLRTGIAAGSSVPESMMRRLFSTLGLQELVICYGMTETAPVSCMTAPNDPLEKRTATVGRVMPHTGVKIVDPSDWSRIVPRGEPGELAASGYLVMKGYWDDAAQTVAVLTQGTDGRTWMHSGDEARMDEDGYVAITGRIKDLIIRGGENIHPLEIENCLFQHPLVAEVSVVGVPDARHGETVSAFIVPHGGVAVDGGLSIGSEGEIPQAEAPEMYGGQEVQEAQVLTAESVQEWVKERLSPHLMPRHVFWTTGYPKTASGKIQKFKLRDAAKQVLASK